MKKKNHKKNQQLFRSGIKTGSVGRRQPNNQFLLALYAVNSMAAIHSNYSLQKYKWHVW